MAVAYLLARNETISNWWLVVITGLVLVGAQRRDQRLDGRRAAERPRRGRCAARRDAADLPLELVGVDRPFTVADREMLDAALGVPAGKR